MANFVHELIDNPNLIEELIHSGYKLIHSGYKKIDMNRSNLHFKTIESICAAFKVRIIC